MGGYSLVGFAPVVGLWAFTLVDVVRTQPEARSEWSQRAWLVLIVFFPFPAVLFYWLGEARRRRRIRGKPVDPA